MRIGYAAANTRLITLGEQAYKATIIEQLFILLTGLAIYTINAILSSI